MHSSSEANELDVSTNQREDESSTANKKLIEFIHDLNEAIQNGNFSFSQSCSSSSNANNQQKNFMQQCNVDNLSNQTFSYIINWLKQHQLKYDNESTNNCNKAENNNLEEQSKFSSSSYQETKNSNINSSESTKSEMLEYLNEIKYLRTKLKQNEFDKEKLLIKINEIQQENVELKTKLISLSSPKTDLNSNETNESLRKLVQELLRANDEKDKKVDELTKQVIRFKRIQEIVLSAQTSNNLGNLNGFNLSNSSTSNIYQNSNKNLSNSKNYEDLNFDFNNDNLTPTSNLNSAQNNTPIQPTQVLNHTLTTTPTPAASIPITQQQITSSCSLSSSISSSSSTTSSSSSTSSANSASTSTSILIPSVQINANSNQMQAPLATISEFANYSSTSTLTTTPKTISNHLDSSSTIANSSSIKNRKNSFTDSNSTLCNLVESQFVNSSLIKNPVNSNTSNGHGNRSSSKSSKYSSAVTLSSSNNTAPSSPTKTSSQSSNKSIRQFFGKLIRTSLVNINDSSSFQLPLNSGSNSKSSNNTLNSNFKRGGFRSTANARLQSNTNLDTLTFSKWSTSQVCEYLNKNGFEAYFTPNSEGLFNHKWIRNGLHLLQASQHDYERDLGIKNALHRKKLSLLLQSMLNTSNNLTLEGQNIVKLDQYWVLKWLDDIGLAQYKDIFNECMTDGRMLMHINNEDFQTLNINSELHYLSINRAIHVLRLNNFDPQCLRRRPSGDEYLDKTEVMLWTNHRVMEWLRSIDLSEYAPNLRGSGVHGGLMVFEARFNSTVLADILSIPSSKTLLRRHLTTLFNDLIGTQMSELKKNAELQPGYQQLSAASKVKHVKKSSIAVANLFSSSHKRTKSQDSRDFLCTPPILLMNQDINKQKEASNKNLNTNKNSHANAGQSATLPPNSSVVYTNDLNENNFKAKLSLLSQENVPTSIV